MYVASCNIQDSFNKFYAMEGKRAQYDNCNVCASRNEIGIILMRTHPSIPRPPQSLRGVRVKKTVLSERMTRIEIDRWIHSPSSGSIRRH